jgi:AcrR family transcriptional regulator
MGRRLGTRHRVPDRAQASGRQLGARALNGGTPALERELRAQGQRTVRRLLEAALAEFDEHGFQAVRVDDIARRALISHGTFYLYFASKEDLFEVLVQGALHDMTILADEFPVVTRNAAGRAALLSWVRSFCRTYEAHATVLWIITRTQVDDADIYSPGLQLFFRLSEIMAERMTVVADRDDAVAAPPEGENVEGATSGHAELTGLLCLLMLEGVNTLLNAEVQLPRDGMAERISDIIYAAFAIP